ncbi:MAG: DUF2304 domain-containing protein [Phycisphaerae bacterium]
MNIFQIIALLLMALLLAATIAATVRGTATRKEGLFWASVWVAAGVAIARPGITATVARGLGIGRGADLVLYCTVVMVLVGFLMVYSRLRRLRREITLLVRHLAIRNAIDKARPDETEARTGHGGEQTTRALSAPQAASERSATGSAGVQADQ